MITAILKDDYNDFKRRLQRLGEEDYSDREIAVIISLNRRNHGVV